jgi:hypothetical protein
VPQAPGAVVLRFSEAVNATTSTAVTGAGEIDATNGLTMPFRVMHGRFGAH